MQHAYLADVPCVLWSNSCGRMPSTFMMISRSARPIVALARSPGPKMLPVLLKPSVLRIGPLTIDDLGLAGGALHQIGARRTTALERVHHRQQDREVLRAAARHDRVDRRLAHIAGPVEMLLDHEHLVWIALGLGQELVDELLDRRHDRQAVGPALLVAVFDQLARAERRRRRP